MLPTGEIVSDQEVWEERQVERWRKTQVLLRLAIEEEKLYRERVVIPKLYGGLYDVARKRDWVEDDHVDVRYNDAYPSCAARRAIVRYKLSGWETVLEGPCLNKYCGCVGIKHD